MDKEETVTTLEKEPILECTHKNTEQCHYTYVTQFTPAQEEICEENFEKVCSITFKQQAYNETIEKCYTPVEKVCNGQGEEECRTVYESSCTTRYVEKSPGKFVADTKCEKLPTELCGAGCTYEEGLEECHDKVITTVSDVPEEVCDLNPQKTCRFITKLVPKLKPTHECTTVPKETCTLKFTTPKQVKKPLLTKWCLDPSEPLPGESYEEENAYAPVLGSGSSPQTYGVPAPRQPGNSYGAPEFSGPGEDYSAPARDNYGGPRQAPVHQERKSSRRNNRRKNKKKKFKQSKKGGNKKKVQSSQKYFAPTSESYVDYEEDFMLDHGPRDDYSGPIQPKIQAARDFSVPSNRYGGPSPTSDDYGAPPSSTNNRDYPTPPSPSLGDYSSPSNENDGAPSELEEVYRPTSDYTSPLSPNKDYSSPSAPTSDYSSPSSPNSDYSSPSSPTRDYSSPSSPASPARDYSSPSSPARDYSSPLSPARDYSSPSKSNRDFSIPSSDYSSPSTDYSSPSSGSSAGRDYSAPTSPAGGYSAPSSLDGYGASSQVSIDFSPSQPVYNSLGASSSYNTPQYVSLEGATPHQMLVRRDKALKMVHSPFSMPRSFFRG